MMKILFLDIDGVLNSTRTSVAFGGYPMELSHINAFDQVAIRLIQRLCDSAGIQIVLSSAWRRTNTAKAVGEAFGLPVIDVTPHGLGNRGSEIQQWLDAHCESVESYAIIDDDPDMLPEQMCRFVRTNGDEGMTWESYVKLCSLFGENAYAGEPRHRNWRQGASLDWHDA